MGGHRGEPVGELGFPSGSHIFRELIPLLADRFHVVAPDFPGFGMSDMPLSSAFDYTFEQIAIVIGRLTEVLGLGRFALYVFDYGAPVGFRVAARYPERVTAIASPRYESLNRTEGDDMSPISRGFRRRHVVPVGAADRVPPGQYVTDGFPVLSAGPTPHTPLTEWTFSIRRGDGTLKSWTWQEFQELPAEAVTVDIHCVTRWSKLDTEWRGVSVSTLLDQVEHDAGYVMAFSDGGYTTNLPLTDVTGGRAWVAYSYGGGPLEPEHGGPARLLVPHLYFWKSAKWVRGLELMDEDQPGFWENYGYHMYGDPWKEQRYQGD